jgi:hypothetical protein
VVGVPKVNDAGRLNVEGLEGAEVVEDWPKGFAEAGAAPNENGDTGAILGDGCANWKGAGAVVTGLSGGF